MIYSKNIAVIATVAVGIALGLSASSAIAADHLDAPALGKGVYVSASDISGSRLAATIENAAKRALRGNREITTAQIANAARNAAAIINRTENLRPGVTWNACDDSGHLCLVITCPDCGNGS